MKNNKIFYFLNSFTVLFLFNINIAYAGVVIPTDVVDTTTQRSAPTAIEEEPQTTTTDVPQMMPFGINLFQGGFTSEREDGLNPDYLIQPGDRISLRIWGATTVNELVIVDAQGNIFIPEIGPIHIEGVRNAELNSRIESALKKVYTQNINVYTNLQATTPVQVYVTGFVNNPGSYAGVASDSILYFLARASGIDSGRGSFRDIKIMRDGEILTQADLYRFLIEGTLPKPQFADGDTIVVGRKGSTITAEGAVRNSFEFEIPTEGINGAKIIELARPWANASYATVIGTRPEGPFSKYFPIDDLEKLTLRDGDQVIFEVDQFHDTILVRVEGSHLGPSRIAVPRNTHLLEILNYIEIDPTLADIDAISLRRESIRIRQKRALEDSLHRLEAAILTKQSITTTGAQIQAQQSKLISDFVNRAKQIEPEGILVVSNKDQISDILLQENDIITIPERTNVIQISGEVMVPQALVYEGNANLGDYIKRVGGYTDRADESKHLIIRRNGEVISTTGMSQSTTIKPGDEIIALPEIPGVGVEILTMIIDVMFKVASTSAIFLAI
jgi:protein involved in polysaccharide export with SLBB domain/bifunctional DNA-binding transcriptional regulator/antitoxin component of YhaV-PrlF toxin-antitoxin module